MIVLCCMHSKLAHEIPMYLEAFHCIILKAKLISFTVLSNTNSAFATEVTECSVLTVVSMPSYGSREHKLTHTSEAVFQDELDKTSLLYNMVVIEGELYQSKTRLVLSVFTSHSYTKVPVTVATTRTSLRCSCYMDSSCR